MKAKELFTSYIVIQFFTTRLQIKIIQAQKPKNFSVGLFLQIHKKNLERDKCIPMC